MGLPKVLKNTEGFESTELAIDRFKTQAYRMFVNHAIPEHKD